MGVWWLDSGFMIIRYSTQAEVTEGLKTGDEVEKHYGQSELHHISKDPYILSANQRTHLQRR